MEDVLGGSQALGQQHLDACAARVKN